MKKRGEYCFIPFKQVALLDRKTALSEGGGEGENTDISAKHIHWGGGKIYIFEITFMLEMQPELV